MPDPRFGEDWPDAFIGGYAISRLLRRSDHENDEPGMAWKIYPAIFEFDGDDPANRPTLAIVGDFTLWAGSEWAGVRAHANLFVRDVEPLTDDEWQAANELTVQHVDWLERGLYDFVAQAMRAMMASGSGLTVPRSTPDYELLLVDIDEVVNDSGFRDAD